MGAISLTGAQAAAVVGASIGLAIAVIVLLTRSTRALNGFTDVLKSYAEIITGLNNELTASYEQRRELREQNEALAERVDDLEANARLQQERLLGLQADKGRLKDALAAMHAQSEQRDRTHRDVVDALTGQIAQLKLALQTEQDARQRGEQVLKQQIEQLTAQNAASAQAASLGAKSEDEPLDESMEPNTPEEGKRP